MNFPLYPINTNNVFGLGVANFSGGTWTNVDRAGNVIGSTIGGGSGPVIDIIPASRDIRPNSGGSSTARRVANEALDRGKEALNNAARGLAKTIPGGEAVIGVADGLGITSECGWICQLQNWIKETGIFQRIAIAILAFVFIGVALSMFGRNANPLSNIAKLAKGK